MKKQVYLAVLVSLVFLLTLTIGCSHIPAQAGAQGLTNGIKTSDSIPFVYDEWEGIPTGKIRLKGYCKRGQWFRNAVAPRHGKIALSPKAVDYLNSLNAPHGQCVHDSSIGSAYWIPATDQIILDDGGEWMGGQQSPKVYTPPPVASISHIGKAPVAPKMLVVKKTVISETVKFVGGSEKQQRLGATLAQEFWGYEKFSFTPSGDRKTTVIGPYGSGKFSFSPEMVKKIQNFRNNPEPGVGLTDICAQQARALVSALGGFTPTDKMARVSVAEYCPDGKCWPHNPSGKYTTMAPFNGVRTVWQINREVNAKQCVVSMKLEYQSPSLRGWHYGYEGWGATTVFRNADVPGCDPNKLMAIVAEKGLPYFRAVLPMKMGQPGDIGQSCWEVEAIQTGFVVKDDSPSSVTF